MKKIYLLSTSIMLSILGFSANHTITITPFGVSTSSLTINAGDNVTFVRSGGYIGAYDFTHNLVTNFSFTLDWSTPSYTHSFSIWDTYYFYGGTPVNLASHMIDIYVIPYSGGGGGGTGGGVSVNSYTVNSVEHYFRENILNLKLPQGEFTDYEYSLININGQIIVDKTTVQSNITSIDLSKTPSGIVFLLIYDEGTLIKREKIMFVKR